MKFKARVKFRSRHSRRVCAPCWQRGVCGLSDWLWLYSTALALISFIYLGWPAYQRAAKLPSERDNRVAGAHTHSHSLTLARHSWKRSSTLRQQVPSPPTPPSPRAPTHREERYTCCDARCLIFYATLYRLAERGSLIKACALICLLLWCSAVFVSEGARGHIGTLASLAYSAQLRKSGFLLLNSCFQRPLARDQLKIAFRLHFLSGQCNLYSFPRSYVQSCIGLIKRLDKW